MRPLDGKIAIVTGASSGIGRGIAQRLASDGAAVVVNYLGDDAGADATVRSIGDAGGRAITAQGDVSQLADVRRVFQRCLAQLGRPHILVNNAGKGILKPLAELDEAMIDDIFGLNAKGTLLCLSQAAVHLEDGGRIVNIASSSAVYPWPGAALYAASKGAVLTMTDVAAVELGARRINVNAVIPGITDTPMTQALPPGATRPVAEASPYKRLGLPADIAAVVAFLVGPDGGWVTGQKILANGGSGH
jgi:3-oxoacyl-[acyl-carrier protein] reductase